MRAYRRPLGDAEVQTYVALFNQGPTLYPGTDAFKAGANLVLQAFLQSPHFLYRTELSTAPVADKVPLSDYEIAAKIAYSLTNSMPDVELFTAAAAGAVHSATDVATQAARLLSNAKGADGRDHFHFQIYRLGAYDGIVRDKAVFPSFSASTPGAMRQETLLFLRFIFDQGFGVKELFTSPVSFVNSDLAPLYGLSGSFGSSLTRVDLDPAQRAGLLTRTGFLASYSVVNDPDSIHRGVFVNQRVLCVQLPPPDPNAGALVPLSTDMTNRERVEATTGPGTCGQGCQPYDITNHETLIQLHMQLMVFAIASGYTRVAVLKIGDREDDHQLTVNGTTFVYHTASHRAVTNGAALCSQVDFMHMRYFKSLLDQLAAVATPTGSLLDAGATVWTNQVATGNHLFESIPCVIAGSAGGYLKTGHFFDVSAQKYRTNRMLNTLINAAGVRKAGGAPVDDFGDSSLAKGVVDEIVA